MSESVVNVNPEENHPVEGTVRSKDGTPVAYSRIGRGSPVILVDGAVCYREFGPSKNLAALLSCNFTVYTYDRRGRGASGNTEPYAVDREIEDIEAILSVAGGSACIWGTSSGGVLALEAANRLHGIKKIALYEAPCIVDGSRPTIEKDWVQIGEAIASHRRSDAVRIFLGSVGVPGAVIAIMRLFPVWSKLTSVAHTLPYDGTIMKDLQCGAPLHAGRWGFINVPALVMDGGRSPLWMRNANRALADIVPTARYRTLEGEAHALKPKVHAPVLAAFFSDAATDAS